ncbi:MAG: hypothetical protein M3Y56_13965 [Armatimonadota bacterium]|nr:hypothetical protein [Armatimonadota bacterium]
MITLDLTPTEEAHLSTVAWQNGLAPAEYIKKLVQEHLPPVEVTAQQEEERKAAAIALLQSWIEAAPTDPEEIRQAEVDVKELMDNLNRNRVESGERPLYP